jgi:hypothetical protein
LQLQETLSPVSVTIPKPELLVLEPPSPYRNPTVEPPISKTFYFGEKVTGANSVSTSSVVENALISDGGAFETISDGPDETKASQKIEVVHFGQV